MFSTNRWWRTYCKRYIVISPWEVFAPGWSQSTERPFKRKTAHFRCPTWLPMIPCMTQRQII
jgi:hypothetical protein